MDHEELILSISNGFFMAKDRTYYQASVNWTLYLCNLSNWPT